MTGNNVCGLGTLLLWNKEQSNWCQICVYLTAETVYKFVLPLQSLNHDQSSPDTALYCVQTEQFCLANQFIKWQTQKTEEFVTDTPLCGWRKCPGKHQLRWAGCLQQDIVKGPLDNTWGDIIVHIGLRGFSLCSSWEQKVTIK